MHLFDLRLRFARDLIGHWLDIRRGALVPLEADLDPRALLHQRDSIGIISLTKPSTLKVEQAGATIRRRFDRDIRHMNWVELVPATLGEAGRCARSRVRRVPCGFYHKFTVALGCGNTAAAETLVLPLRRRNAALPHIAIGITHETAGTPAGWLTPSAHVADYYMEFVDFK